MKEILKRHLKHVTTVAASLACVLVFSSAMADDKVTVSLKQIESVLAKGVYSIDVENEATLTKATDISTRAWIQSGDSVNFLAEFQVFNKNNPELSCDKLVEKNLRNNVVFLKPCSNGNTLVIYLDKKKDLLTLKVYKKDNLEIPYVISKQNANVFYYVPHDGGPIK